jgi:ribosomal protein S18 acetylase RimI-like enzyme
VSEPTPHPQITVDPVNTAHIPSLTRITGLLLPIRYPNGFYTATITDPVIASLSRVAIYHNNNPATANGATSQDSSTDKVIGAIRCRLEHLPHDTTSSSEDHQPARTNLYIQTLLLLSPYRGNGVATSLLDSLLFTSSLPSDSSTSASDKSTRVISPLVKHYGIRAVTAHVHESNEDALHWYIARGFKVEDGVVEGYYRRLNPSGAKIVRLKLPWSDGEEPNNDDDDDGWEKIEAEEVDDTPLSGEFGKGGVKRKADDEIDR